MIFVLGITIVVQRNADGTAIRVRLTGNDCGDQWETKNQRLFDSVIDIENLELIVTIPSYNCINADFTVFNSKGSLESEILEINLLKSKYSTQRIGLDILIDRIIM